MDRINIIALSLLLVLCRYSEAKVEVSPDADFIKAKNGFLQYPSLKNALAFVSSPFLQRASKAIPYGDTRMFFRVLTRRTFNDSKKVKQLYPGDLNADGLQDMLVLTTRSPRKAEVEISHGERPVEFRRVILFLQVEKGVYRYATSNDHVIEDSQAGGAGLGDPFRSIRVSKGKLVFVSMYGSCERTRITSTYVYDRTRQYWYLQSQLDEEYSCNPDKNPSGERSIHRTLQTVKDFGDKKF